MWQTDRQTDGQTGGIAVPITALRIVSNAAALLKSIMTGAPAGFKTVDAQPVGSGASMREMI